MKNVFIALFVLTLLIGCKNDPKNEIPTVSESEITENNVSDTVIASENDIDLQKQIDLEIRKKRLVEKEDERDQLQELIISKRFLKDEDLYTIDFKYPYLNENLKESYGNFNEYITKTYLNIEGVEAQILEDKELLCDTLRINKYREKRYVDYKIYNVNEMLVSVLFYKENFYSGTLHPSYTFDCINFDLGRAVFMNYEDFFIEGSEEELRKILNEILVARIESGEVYYDCWGISEEDFFEYKDNFVVDDKKVEYSVEIPLEELLPVLRRYNLNPLQL